jgi:hypothetical protein
MMSNVDQRTLHPLSDLGWGDTNEDRLGPIGAVLILIAVGGYWASVWVLSGLPPLPLLASNVRWPRRRQAGLGAGKGHG